MDTEYSVYLGQEQKNGFTGFLAEKNFFCIVEIFDGYTVEQGESLMSALAEVAEADFDTLTSFDVSIAGVLKRLNVPLDTSVAISYKKESVLYLKTVGTGEIYIQRGRAYEKIIGGNNTAAGSYQKSDMYILTSSFFTDSLKGVHHIKSFIHKNQNIREYPELVKQQVGMDDDTGAIALFIKMQEVAQTSAGNVYPNHIKEYLKKYTQVSKKNILIGIVIICLAVLGWSVLNGIQKRGGISLNSSQAFDTKMTEAEKLIQDGKSKTDLITEGMTNLGDAKKILVALKKIASKNQQAAINKLEREEAEAESILLKRESKDAKEYTDLASEEKGAVGTKLSLFEDKAFILNPEGKIYIFALEKKSLEKRKLSKSVSTNSLIGGYEKNVYVFDPNEGISKIDELGKSKMIIPKETQWDTISSMQIYNGNIYLLDGGNNALYKYPVTTDAYGERTSYFKGSYLDLNSQSTFAIDIAVYVANTNTVEKYTAGIRDEFSFTIPGAAATITKIITHTDQTELYLWNKKDGLLYINGRDGIYKKQIQSPILKEASDIEVYNGSIYLLKGGIIYQIQL